MASCPLKRRTKTFQYSELQQFEWLMIPVGQLKSHKQPTVHAGITPNYLPVVAQLLSCTVLVLILIDLDAILKLLLCCVSITRDIVYLRPLIYSIMRWERRKVGGGEYEIEILKRYFMDINDMHHCTVPTLCLT